MPAKALYVQLQEKRSSATTGIEIQEYDRHLAVFATPVTSWLYA
jgi:hypothetical protein